MDKDCPLKPERPPALLIFENDDKPKKERSSPHVGLMAHMLSAMKGFSSVDVPKGWECSKCGRVWSPSTEQCYSCNHAVAEIKDSTTWTPDENTMITPPPHFEEGHITS